MTRVLLVGAVVMIVAVAAGFGWLASRGPVSATSTVNPRVTVQCAAATGVSAAACGAWGDQILAEDPATKTFDRRDLRRVTFDRALFGFGAECSVAWFIERDAEEPVWSGSVPCR
jgi:hypothetical protein